MSLRVGIDFGTSNSGVAVYDGSQVHILPIDRGNVVPQVVKTILYITRDLKTTMSIPLFSQMLARLFGAEKIKSADTFSSVAAGLAIRAYEGPEE